MMQEEELVIRDDRPTKHYNQSENSQLNYGQDVLPFTISDGILDDSLKKYVITKFEIFVTLVVMLSTISGGYLEGFTSPAIPTLLRPSDGNHSQYAFQADTMHESSPISFLTTMNKSLYNTEYNNSDTVEKNMSVSLFVNGTESSVNVFSLNNDSVNVNNTGISADNNNTNIGNDNVTYNNNKVKNISYNVTTSTTTAATVTPNTTVTTAATTTFIANNSNTEVGSKENANSSISEEIFNQTLSSEAASGINTDAPHLLSSSAMEFSNHTNSSEEQQEFDDFHITEEEGSWLGSLLLLGAAFGAGISPWLIAIGRRHAIILSAVPRLLGWILVVTSSSVYTFYIGRFLCGISIGAVSPAAPIYISEIAHPSLRGTLNCVVVLGVNVGIFIAALFGTFLGWRGLAVVGGVTVISYFIPSFFIPNSPAWLSLKGRENDARISLRKLRGKGYDIDEELQEILMITEKMSRKKSIPWKDLFTERRSLLPLFVVLLVTVVNRFSGYNAIITYCSLFIHKAVPTVSEYWANVAVCLVQILATLAAMTLVDSWGRRKLLLFSVAIMGFALLSIALCEGIVHLNEGGTWVAVVATMLYVGAYSLGIGPLTWILMGELFPLDARDKASSIVAVCNWLFAFFVTKTYFSLESSAGLSGTCLIYASVCFVGGVSIFFLVPETKGKSLAEIEAHFSYPQKTWLPSIRKFDQALSSILDQEAATIDTYSTFH